jgi:hypothetical protein
MPRAIEAVPIQLNEPLTRFLLRPEIFMNPAKEFRIGAWATPPGVIDPAMRKIPVTSASCWQRLVRRLQLKSTAADKE